MKPKDIFIIAILIVLGSLVESNPVLNADQLAPLGTVGGSLDPIDPVLEAEVNPVIDGLVVGSVLDVVKDPLVDPVENLEAPVEGQKDEINPSPTFTNKISDVAKNMDALLFELVELTRAADVIHSQLADAEVEEGTDSVGNPIELVKVDKKMLEVVLNGLNSVSETLAYNQDLTKDALFSEGIEFMAAKDSALSPAANLYGIEGVAEIDDDDDELPTNLDLNFGDEGVILEPVLIPVDVKPPNPIEEFDRLITAHRFLIKDIIQSIDLENKPIDADGRVSVDKRVIEKLLEVLPRLMESIQDAAGRLSPTNELNLEGVGENVDSQIAQLYGTAEAEGKENLSGSSNDN